ncbi:MAG: hypothetical protein K5929_05405 [Lachnospiraceae bacterium]|nr:hypothetical protein [Lachnospiraceae bacterium]
MKRLGRFLLLCCVAVFFVLIPVSIVHAETVCSSGSAVQKELAEQISVKGNSELVVTTDFSMSKEDILNALDDASISNGRIYYEKVVITTISRGGKYTYKIPVDPANFVKLSVFNSEKKLYTACLKALYECDFSKRFYTGDEGCYDTMFLVLKQHPEYNYSIKATKYKSLSGKVFCGYNVSDQFSGSTISSMIKETDKKADLIVKNVITSGMTDAEKISALHDFVVKNCVFAEKPGKTAYTAYGCLVEEKAVCQGYTGAMNLLLAKCGIYSIGVAGTIIDDGEKHAWNYVKSNGLKYLDATWDDPVPDRGDNILTEYLMTDTGKMEQTHSWEKTEYSEKYIKYSKKFLKTVY